MDSGRTTLKELDFRLTTSAGPASFGAPMVGLIRMSPRLEPLLPTEGLKDGVLCPLVNVGREELQKMVVLNHMRVLL